MAARNSKARKNARRTSALARTRVHLATAQQRVDFYEKQLKTLTKNTGHYVECQESYDYYLAKVQNINKTIANTEAKLA